MKPGTKAINNFRDEDASPVTICTWEELREGKKWKYAERSWASISDAEKTNLGDENYPYRDRHGEYSWSAKFAFKPLPQERVPLAEVKTKEEAEAWVGEWITFTKDWQKSHSHTVGKEVKLEGVSLYEGTFNSWTGHDREGDSWTIGGRRLDDSVCALPQEEPDAEIYTESTNGVITPASGDFRISETYGCEHCGAMKNEQHPEDCPNLIGSSYTFGPLLPQPTREEFLVDLRSSWQPPQADRIRRIFEANRSKEGFHAEPD